MIFNKLIGLFSNDLAIDLGTANTLVIAKGQGIIIWALKTPWQSKFRFGYKTLC